MLPDDSRGERSQVECPDCDTWVILAPSEEVDRGIEVGKQAAAEHYGVQPLATARALAGTCSNCGAQIGLVIARAKKSSPSATA